MEASVSIKPDDDKPRWRPPRTLVVRIATPGTTGDNFGLYVRSRGSRINPSTDAAPAKSWFGFSSPYKSNPYSLGSPNYGLRPPCVQGMCDGIYGNSLPGIQGAQYESKVPLGWSVTLKKNFSSSCHAF